MAGLLLLALLGFGVFVYLWMGSSLARGIDDSLQLSAAQAAAAANIEDGALSLSDSIPNLSAIADMRGRRLTLRILDPDGLPLETVGPHPDTPIRQEDVAAARQGRAQFATLTEPREGAAIRIYTLPIKQLDQIIGIVQVGQTLDTVAETLDQLVQALLISIPLLAGLAAVGGYALAARALLPIDQIIRTAQRISAEELHTRLGLPASDDEVGRLAATLDRMLSRLDESFQRERRFTADASHELRTPLTAIQSILSVTRERRRTPEEYEQALDDLGGQTQRLQGLVEGLLRLARRDQQAPHPFAPVDLSTLVRDVAETLVPLAEAKGLQVIVDVPDGLAVRGDSDELLRLWLNLIDNAIAYTDRGTIEVRASATPALVLVTVRDTGAGIAPEHLPHLFERFYRADGARSGTGAGLGLAIAREIVAAHSGAIELQSQLGVGTCASVRLPRDSGPLP